jgi:MFS superfamily sulfate permease-like transporter
LFLETESLHVTQAGVGFVIRLLQPPQLLGYNRYSTKISWVKMQTFIRNNKMKTKIKTERKKIG